VLRGLDALSDGIDIVLVHDAARPFATPGLAGRVAEAAERHGAAVPVITPPDTVKRVEGKRVEATLDRGAIALAQTPQGFRIEVLRSAYDTLGDRDVTDDAQVAELARVEIATVPGEPGNFKVTTALDLDAAAARAGAGTASCPAGAWSCAEWRSRTRRGSTGIRTPTWPRTPCATPCSAQSRRGT
jgi:2-C-methyl-D-erythritol 4-phosphate cytidylyltransferase/2-C-methyl-D-erythritol 2,4-cyclodiphosphate synthase